MTTLYDMHCHMGFSSDVPALAAGAAEADIEAFSTTVTPDEYKHMCFELAPWPQFHVGLGLHPWWLADGRCGENDIVLFEELAHDAPLIGEIGLDFARERGEGDLRERQVEVLERLLNACRETDASKLVSLHAVRATSTVLDLLEQTHIHAWHRCIIHWFSGTPEELDRAVQLDCFFSVGPRMLATKRGQAIAAAIPAERLLLETDSPDEEGAPPDARDWRSRLDDALGTLAALREEDKESLGDRIAATSAALLGEDL